MTYGPGDSYYAEFTLRDPLDGGSADADATPVATANRNGTDDATFALTVTNLDTGRYKVTGTVPAGYAFGDTVIVTVAATVAGISEKAVLSHDVLDQRVSEIVAEIDATKPAVTLDLTQPVGGGTTLGDALQAAYAQGGGDWVLDLVADTLTLKLKDGSTFCVFDLDDPASPTTRTRQ
jgi:hypothetical protein